MSMAATWCRMLLIASMQWILTNELLRRCKKLANLTSLYFTGPNQRVSEATTSTFYKHGGFGIQKLTEDKDKMKSVLTRKDIRVYSVSIKCCMSSTGLSLEKKVFNIIGNL